MPIISCQAYFVRRILTALALAAAMAVRAADTQPPVLLDATADRNLTNVVASFSEAVTPTSLAATNFDLVATTVPDHRLSIVSAVLMNGTNVLLTTAPRVFGLNYTVLAHDVTDAAINGVGATSSVPVHFEVDLLSIGSSNQWAYFQEGRLPDPAWATPAFDDSAWQQGLPAFYAGFSSPPEPVRTSLRLFNSPPIAFVTTYYFRARFDLPGTPDGSGLRLRFFVDDGAVTYLNGVELHSIGMATNRPISYTNFANRNVASPAYEPPLSQPALTVPAPNLAPEENVLAVEVHRAAAFDFDAAFGVAVETTLAEFGPGARLRVPAYVSEEQGTMLNAGEIALFQPWRSNLTFTLTSSLPFGLQLPANVTVVAGATNVLFDIVTVDNLEQHEPRSVWVAAVSPGLPTLRQPMTFLDNESSNLLLSLPSQVLEIAGTVTNFGTISIDRLLATNLVVNLTSSLPDRVQFPTAIVPAGATSAPVTVEAIDNATPDGAPTVIVTASAPGFTAAQASIKVMNDDPHHFQFAPITSPQIAGSNFSVRITAVEADGSVVPFSGSVGLAAAGPLGDLQVLPTSIGPFTNGQWNGLVSVASVSEGVRLNASFPTAGPSSSGLFAVEPAPIIVSLATRDLAYDGVRDLLYASVPSSGGAQASTVTTLSPSNGSIVATLPLGEPLTTQDPKNGLLAITDDAQFLYAAVSNAYSVRRINLASQSVGAPALVGGTIYDMKTIPGRPERLALSRFSPVTHNLYDIALYQDGLLLPQTVGPPFVCFSIAPGTTPDRLYGFYYYVNSSFNRFTLSDSGVSLRDSVGGVFDVGEPVDLVFNGGLLFNAAGKIVDPEARVILNKIPVSGLPAPDVAANRVVYLSAVSNSFLLRAYQVSDGRPLRSLALPYDGGQPLRFVRSGTNVLAFSTAANRIYFVRSGWLFSNGPIVELAVTQTNSLAAAGSNFTIAVTARNHGTNDAYAVVLNDMLPANAGLVSAVPSQGTATPSGGTVRWQLGALPAGSNATLLLTLSAAEGGWVVNEASLSANELDLRLEDNTVRQSVFVSAPVAPNAVRRFSFPARDLAFDADSGRLYATVGTNALAAANSLSALDPAAGKFLSSTFVGHEPSRLALAPGNRWLYVAVQTNQAIQRFDLQSALPGPVFLVNTSQPSIWTAGEMKVLPEPGEPLAVLRLRYTVDGELVIFDNGVPRPNVAMGVIDSRPRASALEVGEDPSLLFVQGISSSDFKRYRVNTNGVSFLDSDSTLFPSSTAPGLEWGNGRLFGSVGSVIDPVTRTRIGILPGILNSSLMVYDAHSRRILYLIPGGTTATLQAFDAQSLLPLGSTNIAGISGDAFSLTRWGDDGLAFLTTGGQFFLLRTSLLPTNPPADVSVTLQTAAGPYVVGNNITQTLLISNAGPNAAVSVRWSNSLPAGAIVSSATALFGSVQTNGNSVSGSISMLAPGELWEATVVFQPATAAVVFASAGIDSDSIDLNNSNNFASALLWVLPASALPVSGVFPLVTRDMLLDPVRPLFYASLAAGSAGVAGSVVTLDPWNGAAGPVLWSGENPGRLAVSADGQRLYIGLDSASAVQRIDLPSGLPDQRFVVPANGTVVDMAVCPTNSGLVVIRRSPDWRIALIADGAARPNELSGYEDLFAFSDTTGALYACNSFYNGLPLWRVAVGSEGLALLEYQPARQDLLLELKFAGGLLHYNRGMILDPVTRRIHGSLPVSYNYLIEPDVQAGRIYSLAPVGPTMWTLIAHAADQFIEVASTNFLGNADAPSRLTRWGADGIAFRTPTQIAFLRTSLVPTNAPADVRLRIAGTGTPIEVGSPLAMTLTLTNASTNSAWSVVVTQGFSLSVTGLTANVSDGTVTTNGAALAWRMDTLAAGATASMVVQLQPAQAGTLVLRAAARHNANDPVLANNLALFATEVGPPTNQFLSELGLNTRELLYDSAQQRLFASIPASEPFLGNCIAVLNPVTLNIDRCLFAGSEPNQIALSEDGRYLYVGVDGIRALRRLDSAGQQPAMEFDLSRTLMLNAYDIQVQPGHPDTVGATAGWLDTNGGPAGGVLIYDKGVQRPNSAGTTYSIAFSPDGQQLYGSIPLGAGFGFQKLGVSPHGVSLLAWSGAFHDDYEFRMDNGILYSALGRAIDPAIPVLLSEFGPNSTVAPDSRTRRIFQIPLSDTTYELRVYEMGTYQLLGTLPLPGVRPYARNLTRCGEDKLAFRTDNGQQLFVLRTPLAGGVAAVAADLAVTQTAALDPSSPNDRLIFNLTVANYGPGTVSNAVLTVLPPASIAAFSMTPSQGSVTQFTGGLGCRLGLMSPGGVAGIRCVLTVTNTASYTNLASLTGDAPDPNLANNRAITVWGDYDHDGLADDWEVEFFGSPSAANGAPGDDFDGDGFTNLQEFLAGTDPSDPGNVLRITSVSAAGSIATVQFHAGTGNRYQLLRAPALTGPWLPASAVVQGAGRRVRVTDVVPNSAVPWFFRIVQLP
jgi:uncharacterized repeat protein (TIGR01451 family)